MKPLHIIKKEAKCLKACSFFLEKFFLQENFTDALVTKIILSNNDEYLKVFYFCPKNNFFLLKKKLKSNLPLFLKNILANIRFHKVPKVCFIFDKNYEKILLTQNIIDNLKH